jgi:[methyl-Co(III) methanol-specific corrinoid protein]:coenzyme M methyltransferase
MVFKVSAPRERVLDAMRGEKIDRIPVSSVTQVGVIAAMEKVGAFWPEAHTDPVKMANLGKALYKLTGLETARIPFCLTVQAEAFGCEIDLGTIEKTPAVKKSAFNTAGEVKMPSDFLSRGRIPAVMKATTHLKKNSSDLPIIVGIEGAYTLAGHIVGIESLLKWAIRQRDDITKVLEVTTRANIEYAKAVIDAGADVVCVADPSASPDLMSPKDFATFVKPKLTEVANAIKKKGAVGVLHICGGTLKIIKDMAETGFDSLSIEEKVDIVKAKEIIGPKPALIGNVAAAKILFSGTPESVRAEAKRAITAGVNVLAPGCGLPAPTPLENIQALVNAALT